MNHVCKAAVVVMVMLFASFAQAASVNFLNPNNIQDIRFASINDLDINGTLYVATFHHGTTFESLPAPAITFATEASAIVATTSMINHINALSLRGNASAGAVATDKFYIPFSTGQETFTATTDVRITPITYLLGGSIEKIKGSTQLPSGQAYVTFALMDGEVIPLPAAAWMGMSLLGGLGLFNMLRRRRLA